MKTNTKPPVFAPVFEAGIGSDPLLYQLDLFLPVAIVQQAAQVAHGMLCAVLEMEVSAQETAVSHYSLHSLRAIDQSSGQSIAVAVAAAALLTAKRERPRMTASEKIQAAMRILSERYHADW